MKIDKKMFIIIIAGWLVGLIVFLIHFFFPIQNIPVELCADSYPLRPRRYGCHASFLLFLAPAACAVLYFIILSIIRRLLAILYPFTISFFAATLFWPFAFCLFFAIGTPSPLVFLLLTTGSACLLGSSYWYIAILKFPLLYKLLIAPFLVALVFYVSSRLLL